MIGLLIGVKKSVTCARIDRYLDIGMSCANAFNLSYRDDPILVAIMDDRLGARLQINVILRMDMTAVEIDMRSEIHFGRCAPRPTATCTKTGDRRARFPTCTCHTGRYVSKNLRFGAL